MKKLLVSVAAAGILLCFNVNSFANYVDLGVQGGYAFYGNGELKITIPYYGSAKGDEDYSGPQFGLRGHYNMDLNQSLVLGLGGFYQYSKIKFDKAGSMKRNSFGVDVAFIFSLQQMRELFPYGRVFLSYDSVKDSGESLTGAGLGLAGGLEFAVAKSVRLFGELALEGSSTEWEKYGAKIELSLVQLALNVGAKFLIPLK